MSDRIVPGSPKPLTNADLLAALAPYATIAYVGATFAPISHTHSAESIVSGTLSDSRLSSNVPLKNAASNVFTGAATFDSIQVGFNGPTLRNSSGTFWVRNGTNTAWADAVMNSAQAGQYKSMSGDYIQTAGVTGTPWTFLTNAAGALGIKVGNLVISNSYSDIAPTNGLFVKGNAQVVETLTVVGGMVLGQRTKAAVLASSVAVNSGRFQLTDSGQVGWEVYPDGTNWRYSHDNSIVT